MPESWEADIRKGLEDIVKEISKQNLEPTGEDIWLVIMNYAAEKLNIDWHA